MKIGIITFQHAHNFGACMQLYALQQYLTGRGHQVQVINYRQPAIEKSYRIVKRPPSRRLLSKVYYLMKYGLTAIKKPYLLRRRGNYQAFAARYFRLTKPYHSFKELCAADFDLDCLVMGSDKIWNSGITKKLDPAYFGAFVPDRTVRISYAASIGSEKIPENEEIVFKCLLRKVDYISVREATAQKELEKLTDKPVVQVLDPTLLVEKDIYNAFRLENRFKGDYIYVHVHHYTAKSPDLVAVASHISRKTGLPVVHNIQGVKFPHQKGTTFSAGPEGTLAAIKNARLVVSQSYHVTAFALIFNQPFLVVEREKYNSRISDLLKALELEHLLIVDKERIPEISEIGIDYRKVNEKLAKMRLESAAFLEQALAGGKVKPKDWFQSHDAFSCYGCSTCRDVCPAGAIQMQPDEEGFVQPVIHQALCRQCDKCRRLCVYNLQKRTASFKSKAYIAWQKDLEERLNCSSGGMFGAFSGYILDQGGFVVGVRFKDDFTAAYDIASTKAECLAFRYSKYVEPEHNDIYNKTLKALKTGRPVLFTGSPCKIAGLKNFLGREWDNLFLMEIICHCTSSPLIFRKYLGAKERRVKAPVKSVRFHDKSVQGWGQRKLATIIEFEDGTREAFPSRKNLYFNAYVSGYLAKRSCYECEFCGDNGIADITIGDFWGAEQHLDPQLLSAGCSALKIGTEKGMALFQKVAPLLYLKEVPVDEMYKTNHHRPVAISKQRALIFKQVLQEGRDVLEVCDEIYKQKRKK